MTRIELAPEVLDDFDRFIDHLTHFEASDALGRLNQILDAIEVLRHNPLIGRPVPDGMRELIIGRASRGYVALYRYVPDVDTAFILAMRAQRESGYKHQR